MTDKPTLVYDTEVYSNYFLVGFRNIATGQVRFFEMYDGHPLDRLAVSKMLNAYRVVSFNGKRFDVPILAQALGGADCATIKACANAIIVEKLNHWDDAFKARFPHELDLPDHIDLFNVAPGTASLKIYGGRLHSRKLQDLPISPDQEIAPEQRELMRLYCGNDLVTTQDLYTALLPQLTLREQMSTLYGLDVRSRSDAQIAEVVIRSKVKHRTGEFVKPPVIPYGTKFQYRAPEFLTFASEQMQRTLADVQAAEFVVNATGYIDEPEVLKTAVARIGTGQYRMGIGGLHSSEQKVAHYADDEHALADIDATSYYPSIILRLGLYPQQMGPVFLDVYREIVTRRVEAKRAGRKVEADALKITVNGSFGKFGSKYSSLYSPDLLIQTTITGQLSLLMLIEMLEGEGIPVVSANTDGIVIRCPRDRLFDMDQVVAEWEQRTGFNTEATQYRALYSRDVNNYVAMKPDGSVKLKGVFAAAGLAKNPTNEVCIDAVVAHLRSGVPVEDVIYACPDPRKFVTIRACKGGAVKGDQFLGKAVRWYYAQGEEGAIVYSGSGYTVARSEGGKPLMEMPDDVPGDVDYDWYIREARSILADVGVK